MTDTKCCQKCGGEGHLVCRPAKTGKGDAYTVDCEDCDATTPDEHTEPEQAIAQWNGLVRDLRVVTEEMGPPIKFEHVPLMLPKHVDAFQKSMPFYKYAPEQQIDQPPSGQSGSGTV